MLKNIINFIKYHNLFTVAFVVVFVSGGTAFAASPVLRTATEEVLVGKTETIISIDNTALLNTDFNNFDTQLVITEVSEDTEAYYISYTFNTLAVQDGAWGSAFKDGKLTVSKDSLNNTDLQAYVEKQLKEVAQAEIAYLKEVQTSEQKKGDTKKKTIVAYTGLLGLVIDTKEKEVKYETVDTPVNTQIDIPVETPVETPEPTTDLVTPPLSTATFSAEQETTFTTTVTQSIATTTLSVIEIATTTPSDSAQVRPELDTATSTPNQEQSPDTEQATTTPSDSDTQDVQVATSTPNNPTDLTGQVTTTTANTTATQSVATTTLPIVEVATTTAISTPNQ